MAACRRDPLPVLLKLRILKGTPIIRFETSFQLCSRIHCCNEILLRPNPLSIIRLRSCVDRGSVPRSDAFSSGAGIQSMAAIWFYVSGFFDIFLDLCDSVSLQNCILLIPWIWIYNETKQFIFYISQPFRAGTTFPVSDLNIHFAPLFSNSNNNKLCHNHC